MQTRSCTLSHCLAAVMVLASVGYAAPSNNSNKSRPPLLEVTSPKQGATVNGNTFKVDIQVHQAARRLTFRATLNGKDITARFSGSGACQKERCPESALLSRLDGLIQGRNVLRLRIKEWNGNATNTRTAFTWTPSSAVGGGLGTAAPGIFQPNYTFTTLQPGGYQGNGQPWFQISSNAFGTVTKNYPNNPIQCTNSVYLLVEIQRTSLQELSSKCLASANLNAALAAIPSTSFAVLGSLAGINADWSNLNPSAIGGTDYRKVGDQEAPWGYMMVGIGKAPWGIGLESYNTGYERSDAELAQIQGVLTVNAHGMYDLHPSDNAVVTVDGVSKRIQIDGVTYAPPAIDPSATSGFWVLPITRRTLTPTSFADQDNSNCPASCGRVFNSSAQDMAAMSTYMGKVSWRSLIFIVAWGKQPGLSGLTPAANYQPYTILSTFGIPVYTFTKMSDPNSVMAAIVSPDPAVRGSLMFNRQAYVSSTPSTVDQHGQISAVLSRDKYYLQRPISAVQNNFAASPGHLPLDLSFLKTVWQPAGPWPIMDTPGRVNAYQYLSYLIFHNVWPANQQPSDADNDIRSVYDSPFENVDLAGVDPTNQTSYPFPQGGSFTRPDTGVTYTFSQRDLTDVAQQLKAEMVALERVTNVIGTAGFNLRGQLVDEGYGLVHNLLSELNTAVQAGGDVRSELIFRVSDLTEWTASMAGITSLESLLFGSGYWHGVMSGFLNAMSSAGLLDPRGDGIPDYTVGNAAGNLLDKLDGYAVNADAAYDTVFSNVVQDWAKLSAMSQFAEPSQYDRYKFQMQQTLPLMQLAGKRYFMSMLMLAGASGQIDRYIGVAASKPSELGTWAQTETKKSYCKGGMYNDNPASAWMVVPSATQPGLNDLYIVSGDIDNNWTGFMTVDPARASLLDPLFLTDPTTGMPGLPKEVWFTESPAPWRQGWLPSWNPDYETQICKP